ncbi:hypothetical protein HK097_000647 [Rhizophlyctis rosea]|uniref:Uncharacterized protein n=1 Tax=Rhizophlyctis rosea TaxID=64517 RepID=A0AAD5S5A1_9FUNG|nr:hypothetical protein HK097_000647 [Rhizophlyctis rosea]
MTLDPHKRPRVQIAFQILEETPLPNYDGTTPPRTSISSSSSTSTDGFGSPYIEGLPITATDTLHPFDSNNENLAPPKAADAGEDGNSFLVSRAPTVSIHPLTDAKENAQKSFASKLREMVEKMKDLMKEVFHF